MIALFPTEPAFSSLLRRTVQATCDEKLITWHNQPIGVNGVRALLSVAPFVDVQVSNALKSLEDVSKKLNDQTNLSMLMAATTKHYPDTTAAVGAFKELVQCLRSSLLFKDIAKDSHLNKEFLVGTKHRVVWFFFQRPRVPI